MAERYERLAANTDKLYSSGSPLIIVASALLKDNHTGNVIAQVKFQSVDSRQIAAVFADFSARDITGNTLGGVSGYQYLDLNARPGDDFGSNVPAILPDNRTRQFDVCVTKVIFAGGAAWEAAGAIWTRIPEQEPLSLTGKLREQYICDTNTQAAYTPTKYEDLWLCACGRENKGDVCGACGLNCERAFAALDPGTLKKNLEARKEQERQTRVAREAAEAERARLAAWKRKRGLIIGGVAAGVIAAVIAVVMIITQVVIPGNKYADAETLLANGDFGGAIAVFAALGDYKDAADKRMACVTQRREEISRYARTIAAGYHTVGLKTDGAVVAVGLDVYGQCDVTGWRDIVAVSVGFFHTLGLKADETVIAVGNNEFGECDVTDWRDIVAVSAGYFHTAGLKADGTVVAVGHNGYEQCNVSGWRHIAAVSAGEFHTVGLKTDGTVVATGNNENGQCDVSNWRDIVAVSVGRRYTVGLKSDGAVVAVGWNGSDQCDVTDWQDIVAVSAGSGHTVGLKADGTVVASGSNYRGACDVSGCRDIVAVSAGQDHTVGLKADGTVVAVGWNGYGQCDVSGWKLWD